MKRAIKRSYKFISDSIKTFDRYPKIISFTFKREDEFKTIIGGIVSIGRLVVLIMYAYLMFKIMIDREDTSKNITTSVIDLIYDKDPIELQGTTFMFGFAVNSKLINLDEDETYIKMSLTQYNILNEVENSRKEIKLENCTFNHFPSINQNKLKTMGISNYYCPNTTDLYVMGNGYADNYTYFELSFKRCQGTDSKGNACKTDSQIDDALNKAVLTMAIVNTYYDFDNYTNPVQTYFDDQFYYNFVAGFEKGSDIYIRQNSVEQKDSFFRYTPKGDESSFISIEKVKERFKNENPNSKTVMSIQFSKDATSNNYERQIFALLDVFGNIGGVNEILEITGGLIVGLFSGKIFLFSILSALYQVDSTHFDRSKKSQENNQISSANAIERIHTQKTKQESDLKIENMEVISDKNNSYVKTKKLCETNRKAKDLNSEAIRKAADNMKKRYRYGYSIFDLAYNFLVPVKVFCCCKRSLRNLHSRYLLYKKAEDKFAQEFDAVEFARSQRKLKMLMHFLMNKSECFLTAYQKSNAISLSTESDCLSDDPAYTKIPKMLASSKIKQKHIVQVNKFFEEYSKQIHTSKDVNLLHGVYSTNENNFNQKEVATLFEDIHNNNRN